MQNDAKENVDLYVPRKCSATSRIIQPKDHASVQIRVGQVNSEGLYTGESTTVAFCGFIRGKGESDLHFNRLVKEKGILSDLE